MVSRLKKFIKLTDPFPNLWYEFFCYVKAALGTVFLILGAFSIILGFFLWGIIFLVLGIFLFLRIKLIRKLLLN